MMERGFKIKRGVKAQAALEFLTTYGWAFLVILVMIAALAYFGILNPSKLLPDRCNFGTEMECMDYQLTSGAAGSINLRLKNNVGETITTTAITASTDQTASLCTASNIANWQRGNVTNLGFSTCNFDGQGMVSGDKGKVNIEVIYYTVKSGSTYAHTVKGEVYTTLQ